MGLKDFKDFGKERGLYPLRVMQTVVVLMHLMKFPSFLYFTFPFRIRKEHRQILRKKTMGNYMKYMKSKTELKNMKPQKKEISPWTVKAK